MEIIHLLPTHTIVYEENIISKYKEKRRNKVL